MTHTTDCTYEHTCLDCGGTGAIPQRGVVMRVLRALTGWTLYDGCDTCEGNGTVVTDLTMHYSLLSPEPDVGIFGFGVEDEYFTYPDGRPLPQKLVALIDADEAWRERVYVDVSEDASEYPDDDYYPDRYEYDD